MTRLTVPRNPFYAGTMLSALGFPARRREVEGSPADDAPGAWIYNVGLACCAVEVAAAAQRAGLRLVSYAEGPAAADVLIISGTVTDAMAPAVQRLYEQLRPPRRVISYGACSNTGGPYWDSYCVTKGVDQLIPVDLYVPGCPPRPEALLAALAQVAT